jgi:FkbM family methyltransferase
MTAVLSKGLSAPLLGYPKRALRALGRLKQKIQLDDSNRDLLYQVGSHNLRLPPMHPLPTYQLAHPLYDRFLPILAKIVGGSRRYFIDVGANVGDTLLSILPHWAGNIICIEADKLFFQYLTSNVSELGEDASRVTCVRSIIGTGKYRGRVLREGGTASMELTVQAEARPERLDHLIRTLRIGAEALEIIKVDVDGYDADVLISGANCLTSKPILFWEVSIRAEQQKKDVAQLMSMLSRVGYNDVHIFDNYGNLMVRYTSPEVLASLIEYVERQNGKLATRTIYYLDVLMSSEHRREEVSRALDTFCLYGRTGRW